MSLELESNGHQNNLKEVKLPDPEIYEFEEFRLDAPHLMLSRRGGEDLPMTPKQVETLLALVERSGEIVAKDALMDRLWPNAFVEESNLIQNIHILRKTLGETTDGKPMIETLRRRGYRFNGEVKTRVQVRKEIAPHDPPKESAALFKFPTVVTDKVIADKSSVPGASSKNKMFAAVALVLLLAGSFAVGYYFYSLQPASYGDKRSIAVLPIKPVNAAQRDEVYETGIAESLVHTLGSMKGFRVLPHSATRQYSNLAQDPLAAGREQKVDYVLASNYQIADGKIRITSQLFNIATGQIDETYKSEKQTSDVFAMQDAIASEIGKLLLTRFATTSSSPAAKRGTSNEEAYRLYLQGAALAEKQTQEEVRKAVEYFEQAVRLDPNYALAYAGLANAQTIAARNGSGDRHEQYLKTKAAIEKALAIDDNLAEAHSYLGEIKTTYEWDFPGAEREHKRAVALDPNSSAAHRMYALLLGFLGRQDESVAEIKTAIDLEPASVMNHFNYGMILFFARRNDEAITEFERIVERDPEYYFAYNWLRHSYRLKGNDDKAFESLVQMRIIEGEDSDEINSWKTIYAKSGWRGIFGQLLEESKADEKKGKPNYNQLAWYSIELEQREQAFAYLEKAVGQRQWAMVTLNVNPRFDPLRDDPRFDALLKRIGLK